MPCLCWPVIRYHSLLCLCPVACCQVCLLGSGSIIGDMSVREGPAGPPRRSATVVALTELLTYKVPLREFKRRMPPDVLEVRTRAHLQV